jgi:uncharacterized phiE125 gp8 family phage protein
MYKLINSPSVEPVSVTELKSQLRITNSTQDTMLLALTKAARQHVEDYLRYSIITATWELYLDEFPPSGECIWIQKSPVTSITFLKYINSDGVLTTLIENTDFVSDYNSLPACIYEAYNQMWPIPRLIKNSVIVRFVAGYANAAAVPEQIKQAILMLASSLYENPSDEVTGTQVNQINLTSERLLRPLRAMRY